MALFDNSPFTPNIKGKIGGTSFSNSLAGRVIKNGGRRTNNVSTRTAGTKATMDILSSAWCNLTDAQRAQWSAMAIFKPTSQKRNLGHFINGQQMFQLYNGAYFRFWDTIATTPNLSVFAFPNIIFQVERSGIDLILHADQNVTDTQNFLNFKISAPIRASRANPPGGTKYIKAAFGITDSADISGAYVQAYGILPSAGDWVFVEYRWFAEPSTDFTNITRIKLQIQ